MNWVSTRDPSHRVGFREAATRSMAPGGGLYVPASLPKLDVDALLALPYPERSARILAALVDDLPAEVVKRAAVEALDFPIPIVPVVPRIHALELFHGPTLAFKDVGARFLARILRAIGDDRPRTVLTATSGDTGAAVAHAFWKIPGFRVIVLYPRGRIAPLQERQFCTLGDNVTTYAVAGAFDDCQRMVKACFDDPALSARLGLVSANSIHVARLIAQITYYWELAAQIPDAVVSVPSGNFGNLCAGILARRLGAPIRSLVAATNANSTVPDYLAGAAYTPRTSVATLSNAMDVGAPSNWERIRWLYADDREAMRADLRWGSISDARTAEVMRSTWEGAGYVLDPHGAVAFDVLRDRLGPDERGVFLETAHPAKFLDVVARAVGVRPEIPPSLAERAELPVLSATLPADLAALVRAIG